MNDLSFVEYATLPDLTADETYTIELLIDKVQWKFDETHWDTSSERSDARQAPDYQPTFSLEHIHTVEQELAQLWWLNFQRSNDAERPVRDLRALRYLPKLSDLILTNNEVSDLTPLAHAQKLRRLDLEKNPIRDLSPLAACANLKKLKLGQMPLKDLGPLAGCGNLEELELGGTSIEDFSVLQIMPSLRKLSLSSDQLPAFCELTHVPTVRRLDLNGEFDSFADFPSMPELRVIWSAHIKSLSGIERFPKLENLINCWGVPTLEPLRHSTTLTHANFLRSHIKSLEPLSRVTTLRELRLCTDARKLDLRPLEKLPRLHVISVTCNEKDAKDLEKFRSWLPSWDVEFLSDQQRHTPSLEIQVVDEETFEFYDTQQPFNRSDPDTNEEMLGSELDWLAEKLEKLLAAKFKQDDDYSIPMRWLGARSLTVVLYSDRAVAAFPQLVLGMQQILAHAKMDWIIYFQSDGPKPEFIVWVYPDKIQVTEKFAETVRQLINR